MSIPSGPPQPRPDGDSDQQRFVVVTQDGMGVSEREGQEDGATSPADLVEQPAKVMRIGSMIKQLLEEVRNAPLDEAGRTRLAEIHRRSIAELKQGLAPELIDELDRLIQPFDEAPPTESELRIAQAQLVGWLEGLFHGIQTAIYAQQVSARAQFEQMRRALPSGPGQQVPRPGLPQQAEGDPGSAQGGGMYL